MLQASKWVWVITEEENISLKKAVSNKEIYSHRLVLMAKWN
jgi:hypothetical protein